LVSCRTLSLTNPKPRYSIAAAPSGSSVEPASASARSVSSFGTVSGVADGIPLNVVLNVQDVADGGNPLTGAAVYVWHCDAAGNYSLYSDGVTGENYLRGVQEVDGDGNVTFTTIYPGCYSGRLAAHPLRGVREPGCRHPQP